MVVANAAALKCLEFTLPSDLAAQQAVHERIVAQIRDASCTDRDEFCVRLALEEALTNAIRHGNKQHPDKKVFVRSTLSDGTISIEIQDEGPGFQPDELPDPTAADNLNRSSGRGVLLIRSFMDEVKYNEVGNKVIMKKRLGSKPPSAEA